VVQYATMTCERDFVLFEQKHPSGCGPTTLRMIYSGYGIKLSEEQIIHEMGMDDEGARTFLAIEKKPIGET